MTKQNYDDLGSTVKRLSRIDVPSKGIRKTLRSLSEQNRDNYILVLSLFKEISEVKYLNTINTPRLFLETVPEAQKNKFLKMMYVVILKAYEQGTGIDNITDLLEKAYLQGRAITDQKLLDGSGKSQQDAYTNKFYNAVIKKAKLTDTNFYEQLKSFIKNPPKSALKQ